MIYENAVSSRDIEAGYFAPARRHRQRRFGPENAPESSTGFTIFALKVLLGIHKRRIRRPALRQHAK